MTTIDHGLLNLPLSKRGAGSLDRQIDQALAEQRKQAADRAREDRDARAAARAAEQARPKFEAADLRGAVAVRDRFGWHRIVRVSQKSVTVETPYSWTDRIALDKVLEVRK